MSDILRRAFDRAVLAAERRAWTPGRLGMTNADGTVTISVPDRPNWVYVALGPDGSQGVTVARNDAGVPLRVYLPVKMRREESGVMAIQGVYNAGGLADVGASGEAIYTDYGTTPHKHGGDDIPDAVLIDGTRALTANWDIGETKRILSDGLQARSAAGLRLEDDAGNLGIFIKDGGDVGLGTTSPSYKLDVNGTLGVSGNTTLGGTLGVTGNAAFSGNVGIGTASPATILMTYGDDDEATTPGSAVKGAIRIAKGGLSAFGERAEVQFAFGGPARIPGAAVSATYTGWASGANPLGTALRFATAPTNGTLTDRMTITSAGDVGIGTTSPSYKLDVNGTLGVSGNTTLGGALGVTGIIYSDGGLGWNHSKASVAHNVTTDIATYTISSNTVSQMLATVTTSGSGRLGTKAYLVSTAWTTVTVTELGGSLFGTTSLALTAAINTTTRVVTLSVKQTNGSSGADTVYISVQPLSLGASTRYISNWTGL